MHIHRNAALCWLRHHRRELALAAALVITVALALAASPFLLAVSFIEWRSTGKPKRLVAVALLSMLAVAIRWLWLELHRAPHRPWHPCAQCGESIEEPSRAAYCSFACRRYARLERDAAALDPRISERAERRLTAIRLRALADQRPEWNEVPF